MSETSDAAKPIGCPYCGAVHERTVCHLVKAIEYHPNGSIKRVEFKEESNWRPATGAVVTPF